LFFLDNSGQVSGVGTVGYGGGVTQFASQLRYRASGGLKSMSYANGASLSFGYNSRGAMSSYTFSGASYSGTTPLPVAGAYQYYDDGRLKFAQDQGASNSIKDRAYQYDHEGRLREAYSGSEARDFINQTNSGAATGPYRESFNYDAWENTLSSGGRLWSRNEVTTASFNQANRNPAWSYDAQGNVTSRNEGQNPLQSPQYSYDAAGRNASVSQSRTCWKEPQHQLNLHVYKNSHTYDGDGQETRYLQEHRIGLNGPPESGWPVTTFYLRSTVLGGRVISQYQGFSGEPQWNGTYVYAGGQRIGFLSSYGQGLARNFWRSADPLTGDEVNTTDNGVVSTQSTFDAQGVEVGLSDPFPPSGEGDGVCVEYDPTFNPPERFAARLIPDGPSARCVIDGIEQNCQSVSSEAAAQCPDNDCGPRVRKDGTLSQTFQAFTDGWSGFLPQGAIYDGTGEWHIPLGDKDNALGKQRSVRPENGVYGLRFNHASSLPQNPHKGSGKSGDDSPGGKEGATPGGKAGEPWDSLGVEAAWVPIRCQHLRELLNREAKYGTQKAARMSMSIRGDNSLYGLMNGPGAMTVDGKPLDQDWLVTLDAFAFNRGFQVAAAFYEAGKRVNRLGKKSSPAWQEEGERRAVDLAGAGVPFSSIFSERFMSKVCPGY
jgi:YD repeat-containing protein